MAQNKNQHYVPRCHLDAFSADGNRKSINMLNIVNNKRVRNAPIKGQCAKAYFYGEDLALERSLQAPEGAYAAVVREASAPNFTITPQSAAVLKQFWMLQYYRTEASSRRAAMMWADQGEIAFGSDVPPEWRMSDQEVLRLGMRIALQNLHLINDLKVCLIRNETRVPFITSDDPAIIANRWHSQNRLARGVTPGGGSSGALLMLPLSPAIYCIVYDGDVYNVANSGGWVTVDRLADITFLNQFQILKCLNTIYFNNWDSVDYAQQLAERYIPIRPKKRHEILKLVLAYKDENGDHYRPFDGSDADALKPAIIHMQAHEGQPNHWPSFIRFRFQPKIYTNGTAVGFVRKATVETEFKGVEGFRLVR